MAAPEIFLSAGEASGDLHAAALLEALRAIAPPFVARGVGGPRLAAAGQEQDARIDELSIVGVTEALPRLGSILGLLHRLGREIGRRRPAAVIVVDAPDFNLRLARAARRHGTRVVSFISPQVWAWRRGRLAAMRRDVDLVLCILPFEEEHYREAGIRARYVGHPLVDLVRPSAPRERLRAGLGGNDGRPLVALLPGSRAGELRRIVPPLVGAARILARREPRPRFVVPAASARLRALLEPLAREPVGAEILEGRSWDCLAAADAAVVASGTATLEAALIGTPFLVVYRLSGPSYAVGKALVRVPFISLPNLLLGEEAVRELVQGACTAEAIATEAARLLDDPAAASAVRDKCATVRGLLGPGGAARRAAEAVAAELGWIGNPPVAAE